MWTVTQLAADLAAGKTSSRELVEQALAKINDPAGEGSRAFVKVYADAARADADYSDRLRKAGVRRSPVDGLPVSLKDLYDVAGDVTRAGAKVRENEPPAKVDAVAVARLRAAGAVFVGRSNMVEFAFGGVGLNPHYGTPKNPYDRKTGRVPGGSSSGAAVGQADGMAVMSLGSDTRGSIRGPSALCGITGWKPTARRVPREGAFPLSFTLDSVGPLANSVACCAVYDAVLAAERPQALPKIPMKGLRFLLPRSAAIEDLDEQVSAAFDATLATLSKAGAVITEVRVPGFDRQAEFFKGGGFAGAEAYHIHRANQERLDQYDPRVGKRILFGKVLSASDYMAFGDMRVEFMNEVQAVAAGFDAILMPTAPCIAPTIAEAGASDEEYMRWNMRILRNCGLINFLDGCAASVPCHEHGTAPVGLMVCGTAGTDGHTLAVAAAIEQARPRD
jgi:aspartyl-tRNA(Asn)/glutamyl-tRNA(Gln) amidotransferase subunit A